ncbi:MAG: hypothetical protein LIO96_07960 [Lachnospiraceae bacterium]|nr:hypothetical protein [Lachnospiraceae bacterium]
METITRVKTKTIIQPLQFHELFDVQVNECLENGWGLNSWDDVRAIQVINGDTLIAFLYKNEEITA